MFVLGARPVEEAKVFENPNTVPVNSGAYSGIIGYSPPVTKPYKHMPVKINANTAITLQPTNGTRPIHMAGPSEALKF